MSKDTRVEIIECACGCGQTFNKYDGNYRTREYISGHNNRKYDDHKEHKRAWYHKHKEARKEIMCTWKKQNRYNRKWKVLEYLGDTCISCGLVHDKKNTPIFDLHHVIEEDKLFNLSAQKMTDRSMEEIWTEVEKCVILCSNCHRLHHHTDLVNITEEVLNERIPYTETE